MKSLKSGKSLLFISTLLFVFTCCERKGNNADVTTKLVDSLLYENEHLRKEIMKLREDNQEVKNKSEIPKEASMEVKMLVGSFVEASLGDCFHLSFKDTSGTVINFDNTDNIYGRDIFDRSESLKLKKGISKRLFKIWYATLKGIDCQDADSYNVDSPKTYVDMPTIIKVEELNNKVSK